MKKLSLLSACDYPMLQEGAFVSSEILDAPGPDGFVNTSPVDGVIDVDFSVKPTELTQVQVKAPADSTPGEIVTVSVLYTDVDGKTKTKVYFLIDFYEKLLSLLTMLNICLISFHNVFHYVQKTTKPVSGPGDIIDVKVPSNFGPVDGITITVTRKVPGLPQAPPVTSVEVIIKGCVESK